GLLLVKAGHRTALEDPWLSKTSCVYLATGTHARLISLHRGSAGETSGCQSDDSPSIKPSGTFPRRPSQVEEPRFARPNTRGLSSRSTRHGGPITICGSSTTASLNPGRSPKDLRLTQQTNAWLSKWRITRWTMVTSKGPSPKVSMAAARSCCG